MKLARVMMIDAKAPAYLWPFAIETAVYTVVRLIPEGKTKSPLQSYREMLNLPNPLPSTKHLRVWFSEPLHIYGIKHLIRSCEDYGSNLLSMIRASICEKMAL
jgi:hypothetical protein